MFPCRKTIYECDRFPLTILKTMLILEGLAERECTGVLISSTTQRYWPQSHEEAAVFFGASKMKVKES